MRAAVLKEWGTPLVTEDVAAPVLGTGEVIVDMVATNLPSYAAEVFSGERKYPLVLPAARVPGALAACVRSARMRRVLRSEIGFIVTAPSIRATTHSRPTSRSKA